MSARENFERQMRQQLEQLRAEYHAVKEKTAAMEADLEAEYFTRIDELKIELQQAEQKLELFAETHDDQWEEFKQDLERSWESLRSLIKAVTGP